MRKSAMAAGDGHGPIAHGSESGPFTPTGQRHRFREADAITGDPQQRGEGEDQPGQALVPGGATERCDAFAYPHRLHQSLLRNAEHQPGEQQPRDGEEDEHEGHTEGHPLTETDGWSIGPVGLPHFHEHEVRRGSHGCGHAPDGGTVGHGEQQRHGKLLLCRRCLLVIQQAQRDGQHHQHATGAVHPHAEQGTSDEHAPDEAWSGATHTRHDVQGDALVQSATLNGQGQQETTEEEVDDLLAVVGRGARHRIDTEHREQHHGQQGGHGQWHRLADPPHGHPCHDAGHERRLRTEVPEQHKDKRAEGGTEDAEQQGAHDEGDAMEAAR
jgi:hypothetical protein